MTRRDPPVQNLAELLEDSAARFPSRTAVVAPDGRRLAYGELNERADRVARFLAARGVAAGDRVGLCLPKGLESVAVIFGALKIRAAYVPVDANGPAARNATILKEAEAAALFVAERRDDVAAALGDGGPKTLVRVPDDGGGVFAEALAHAPPRTGADARAARSRDDLAYLLFTSGSTGVPKGVALTHGNALSFVDWCSETFAPTEDERFSSHAPFHFDLSVLDLYLPLKHGATLFLIGEELSKDPKALARFVAANRLTSWYSTPSVLALLGELGGLAALDLSALRRVLFAGEVFPVAALRRLTRELPRVREFWNLYGPTETNVCTAYRVPTPIADGRSRPFPIGRACSHCEGIVLEVGRDGGEAREAARGAEGRLWIAGPSLFRGYWKRPELDRAVFRERDGRRWYDTGDVVREAVDGEDAGAGFLFVGRRDRMVKRRGHRVELGEIEAALQRHPSLREAAVVAASDADAGVTILAHVVAAGARPSLVDLKRFCAQELPASMSPDRFVFHDALPRTSTDKVDYQALIRR